MSGSVVGDVQSAANVNVEMDWLGSGSGTRQTRAGGTSDGTPPAQCHGPRTGVTAENGDIAWHGGCSCCPIPETTEAASGGQATVTSSSSSGTIVDARVSSEPAQQFVEERRNPLYGDNSRAGGNLAENMEDEILSDAREQYIPVGQFPPRSAAPWSHAQGQHVSVGKDGMNTPVQQRTAPHGRDQRHLPRIPEKYRTWAKRDLGLKEDTLNSPIKVLESYASSSWQKGLTSKPARLRTIKLSEYCNRLADGPDNVVRIIIFDRSGVMMDNPRPERSNQIPNQDKVGPLEKVFRIPSFFWSSGKRHIGGNYISQTSRLGSSASGQETRIRESMLVLRGKRYNPDPPDKNKVFTWFSVHFFLRSLPGCVELFCLGENSLPGFLRSLTDALSCPRTTDKILANPFILHSLIFNEWRLICTNVFWRLREKIEAIERKSVGDEGPDYAELHDIAKHVTHLTHEIAPNNLNIATAMRDDYKIVQLPSGSSSIALYEEEIDWFEEANNAWSPYGNTFKEIEEMVLAMRLSLNACMTLEKRVNNQIDLAYNLVQQRNARTQTDIADATRTDSIAMKTISIVTLIFLPATAVGTVFSMPFFESEHLVVSKDFWIYWAFTGPITFLTVATWYIWQRYAVEKMKKRAAQAASEYEKKYQDSGASAGGGVATVSSGFSTYTLGILSKNRVKVETSEV